MKIKKKEPAQPEYLEEIHADEPDLEELLEKIQQHKKILTQILSKISIKTFLVIFIKISDFFLFFV